MEAADWLYGVSMADNGVSKVISRRLPPAEREIAGPRAATPELDQQPQSDALDPHEDADAHGETGEHEDAHEMAEVA
jgi:hypothetical protein